jgi:hypothetical protein
MVMDTRQVSSNLWRFYLKNHDGIRFDIKLGSQFHFSVLFFKGLKQSDFVSAKHEQQCSETTHRIDKSH